MVNLRETENFIKVKCSVKRLDDVFPSLGVNRLDFIKCDVEGSELLVFQGGYETIKKYKPMIFSEMLRKWASKFNYHPNKIISSLKDLGYRCFIIRNGQLNEFFKMDDKTLETNFLFLHAEKHKDHLPENVTGKGREG
jgi:hypothetical protein